MPFLKGGRPFHYLRLRGTGQDGQRNDQGREMHGHKITDVQIYFADPHSSWQRGSNENTNDLLRQYMPKGMDLPILSQDEFDAIALSLNTRPRARLNIASPLVVYTRYIALLQHLTDTVN